MSKFKKRNTPAAALDIGIWMNIIEAASFISIVTSIFIVLFTSKAMETMYPDMDQPSKVIAIFVIEHVVLFFKFLLSELIPDVAEWQIAEKEAMRNRVK